MIEVNENIFLKFMEIGKFRIKVPEDPISAEDSLCFEDGAFLPHLLERMSAVPPCARRGGRPKEASASSFQLVDSHTGSLSKALTSCAITMEIKLLCDLQRGYILSE